MHGMNAHGLSALSPTAWRGYLTKHARFFPGGGVVHGQIGVRTPRRRWAVAVVIGEYRAGPAGGAQEAVAAISPPLSTGCWPTTRCNRGGIIWGDRRSSRVMWRSLPRCRSVWPCIRVRWVSGPWSCAWMSRPVYSPARAQPPPWRHTQANQPESNTTMSAREPCASLLVVIPAPGRSVPQQLRGNSRENASPFWRPWRGRWPSTS